MSVLKLISLEEDRVPHAYQDHLGYWTIGDGILIDKRKNGGLRPEEMDFITNNRMKLLDSELKKKLPWVASLSEPRQAVLLSMAWQMGVEGLLGFTNTLKFIEAGDFKNAAANMLKSKWAQQTPNRAKRHALQMVTNEWQYNE